MRNTSAATLTSPIATRKTASNPPTCVASAARNGPTNIPTRFVPPSSDIARPRSSGGTTSLTYASRASAHADHPHPCTNASAANTTSDVVSIQPTSVRTTVAEAPTIVARSPKRESAQPAGMSNASTPRPRSATTKPARAGEAPRSRAASATIAIRLPSPMKNRIDGR